MKPTDLLRVALISKRAQELVPVGGPGIMDRVGTGLNTAKDVVGTGLRTAGDAVGSGLGTAKDWVGKHPGATAGIAGGVGAAALLAAMLSRGGAQKKRRGLAAA